MKKEEILKKLRDAGDYVSGQELCEHYGVSHCHMESNPPA